MSISERAEQLGLAAYVLMLLGIASLGVLCAGFSSYGIIAQSVEPRPLLAAYDVPPWVFQEMAKWGVLQEGDRIRLYHDDGLRPNGETGCAVVNDRLVRWELRRKQQDIPLAGATVTVDGDAVRVGTITCTFEREEDRDRFARMIQAESRGEASP